MRGGPVQGPASSSGSASASRRGANSSPPAVISARDHQRCGSSPSSSSSVRPVWLRRHVGPFAGVDIDSRETFFVLRDVVHEVDATGRTELELLGEEPHRW